MGLSFPYVPHYHYDLRLSRVFSAENRENHGKPRENHGKKGNFPYLEICNLLILLNTAFWHGRCYVTGSGNYAAIIPREGRRRKS